MKKLRRAERKLDNVHEYDIVIGRALYSDCELVWLVTYNVSHRRTKGPNGDTVKQKGSVNKPR